MRFGGSAAGPSYRRVLDGGQRSYAEVAALSAGRYRTSGEPDANRGGLWIAHPRWAQVFLMIQIWRSAASSLNSHSPAALPSLNALYSKRKLEYS